MDSLQLSLKKNTRILLGHMYKHDMILDCCKQILIQLSHLNYVFFLD